MPSFNSVMNKLFGSSSERAVKKIQPIVEKIEALGPHYKEMSDSELRQQTDILKEKLNTGSTLDDILPEAFAVAREASDRVLGIRHYPVQIIGGIVLHQGRIAEMATGEGKTNTEVLPAYLNALTGKGVHIVTVNDYLARRDSELMGKIYRFLGLSVGLVVHGVSKEERKAAYAADITYGTNNEFGFDYLRDNMATSKEQTVQRGHNFVIVDEVDSILIDEARTPLIISGTGEKASSLYMEADAFVYGLKKYVVKDIDAKEDQDELDCDYLVNEKQRTAVLTGRGINKAEEFFGVENLSDPENETLYHHINQAIKARGIMKRDIDYVVKNGEVIIVDEFTGRLMYGRRFNEGLHQAIEAKEGIDVANESKTLATVTFQNYFRLYNKLSGMTGTAITEENEFMEIYKLDVVTIPTNKPVIRVDHNDIVYRTEKAKFNAVVEKIKEISIIKGQPVLVGTISVEKSEYLSGLLKREGIKHNVLNAKNHEREAEIIAQAGKYGAVTIATNMAGRGTDIMLGGNPDYMAKEDMRRLGFEEEMIAEADSYAETDDATVLNARAEYQKLRERHRVDTVAEGQKVREAGGLYVIGTERHESRRIDNQLRGRSGRQGDPGESCFFISLEDDLMRLFGTSRMDSMMTALGVDNDTPLEGKMLSKAISNAQENKESINFQARKSVLEYDDVMNTQRLVIYKQRQEVLDGKDISESLVNMRRNYFQEEVSAAMNGNDYFSSRAEFDTLVQATEGIFYPKASWTISDGELSHLTQDAAVEMLMDMSNAVYAEKEKRYSPEVMREVERQILLRTVDEYWMDQIDAMQDLKQGIVLRAYAQTDPVVAYKREGYEMYSDMIRAIQRDAVRRLFLVRVKITQPAPGAGVQ